MPNTLPVNEIFYSLSGEGQSAGQPAIFIRIAGCNLAEQGTPCRYCDTPYSWYKENGTEQEVEEIAKKVLFHQSKNIIITGGEPLHHDISGLVSKLWMIGLNIEIETNGSIALPNYRWGSYISLDIKCPSSGNDDFNIYENISLLNPKDQVKFVISNEADFVFARKIIERYIPMSLIYFQPSWKELEASKLAEWIKYELPKDIRDKVRLGLQQHKILWGEKRGV